MTTSPTPAAAVSLPEPSAHMYPSDLERFETSETFAQAYSVAVGNPDERSVPVFTLSKLTEYAATREAELIAERDQLRADAERYAKLKARLIGADFDWNESGTSILAFEVPDGFRVSADCDAMVDALSAPAVGVE